MKRTIIAGLSAALPLLALAWAMELFRAVGLALFAWGADRYLALRAAERGQGIQ